MAALDDSIAALQAQVANDTTVEGSAKLLIDGFAKRLADAVAAAAAAGATPAQLDQLKQLGASLDNASADLAASVAANTPGGPPAARKR